MGAVGVRARWLLRRNWRATVLLALAAGLAAGLAMTAWLSARRASVAFDEFFAMADPPELTVTFCEPGVTDVDAESLFDCFAYQPTAELETLRSLPQVTGAFRQAYQAADLARVGSPGTERGYLTTVGDAGLVTPLGRPDVLQGRLADPAADDEVMVSEGARRRYGLGLGDVLDVHWVTDDDFRSDGPATGPRRQLHVVGVVRTLEDLSVLGPEGDADTEVFVGPGVWAAVEDDAWFGFSAIAVQARDGDAAVAHDAVQAAFPDRPFNNQFGFSTDDVQPIVEAFGYEAKAATAVAVLVGLAALIFVGQAIARQARKESSDLGVLQAMGFTVRQAGLAAAGRGVVIGIAGAVVATVTTVALSPLTPVGAARDAELHPGFRLDPLVVVVGMLVVTALVTLVAWAPVHRLARRARHSARARQHLVIPGTALPPPAVAGVGMALNSGRNGTGLPLGTAIAGLAFAIGVIVASFALAGSLHELLDHSGRYGAPWDVALQSDSTDALRRLMPDVASQPGVAAASAMFGTELLIDDESTWAIALEPLPGGTAAIGPVITAGREPIRDDEIVLGALTQREIGKHIGDTVQITTSLSTSDTMTLRIVGTVVMNAIDEGSPGFGAVTTPAFLRTAQPDEGIDALAIDLVDGPTGEQARQDLGAAVADSGLVDLINPVKQEAVRNVERLRSLPYLFAAIVAVLGIGSLAHILVLSIRRNRGQLAILKTLGFTRLQVSATVAWQATLVAVVGALIGVPAGIILGRWVWRAVADRLGLVSPSVVPTVPIVGAVLVAILVANIVAIAPGWRAGRVRPAEALRAE